MLVVGRFADSQITKRRRRSCFFNSNNALPQAYTPKPTSFKRCFSVQTKCILLLQHIQTPTRPPLCQTAISFHCVARQQQQGQAGPTVQNHQQQEERRRRNQCCLAPLLLHRMLLRMSVHAMSEQLPCNRRRQRRSCWSWREKPARTTEHEHGCL